MNDNFLQQNFYKIHVDEKNYIVCSFYFWLKLAKASNNLNTFKKNKHI